MQIKLTLDTAAIGVVSIADGSLRPQIRRASGAPLSAVQARSSMISCAGQRCHLVGWLRTMEHSGSPMLKYFQTRHRALH